MITQQHYLVFADRGRRMRIEGRTFQSMVHLHVKISNTAATTAVKKTSPIDKTNEKYHI